MASSLSFTAAEACDVNEATESPAKSTDESTTAIFIYFTPLVTAGSYGRTACKAQSGLLTVESFARIRDLMNRCFTLLCAVQSFVQQEIVSGVEKKRPCVVVNMPFLLPLRLIESRDYLTRREHPRHSADLHRHSPRPAAVRMPPRLLQSRAKRSKVETAKTCSGAHIPVDTID
jgi:hypothetical protein